MAIASNNWQFPVTPWICWDLRRISESRRGSSLPQRLKPPLPRCLNAPNLELEQLTQQGHMRLVIAWIPSYHAIVIQSFRTGGTEDVFNGRNTKAARQTCPRSVWRIAARKLDQLDSLVSLDELRIPPGNRLEALSGGRRGQHSIRINDQYRICFVWTDSGPEQVEIVDYH